MVNQAALDGWVKSTDPNSGRMFYANHRTRVTQWGAPPGWNDEPAHAAHAPVPRPSPAAATTSGYGHGDALPAGWEEMKDPSTGRSFYVDHARQITTWTRPTTTSSTGNSAGTANGSHSYSHSHSLPYGSGNTTTVGSSSSQSSSSNHHWTALQRPSQSSAQSAMPLQARQQQQQQHPTTIFRSNSNVSAGSASRRTWSHDASYFRPSVVHQGVDFSDSMSKLDFKVQKVEDRLRPTCASCNETFSLSRRRHHCRLCGDVFCHECSPNKASLPLEGPEFDHPVRICKTCYPEVEQGNFFSLRRYLTPLTLYDPPSNERTLDEEDGVATAKTVAAALCALTSDLEALILNASDVETKLTIAPEILVPAITKHLTLRATSDRAVCAIAALLSLGSIVNNTKWAMAVYKLGGKVAIDNILTLLERSGSDRRTLFVQEVAAKSIFYLSDAQVLKQLAQQGGYEESLDIPRSLRAMIDHASNSKNPNLQRWAASSIRHLVCEDERRTTSSANDIAASLAAGIECTTTQYNSFLPELISTGGILILASLIGADDSDIRAHTTGALGAILDVTRALNESLNTLYEMTGGQAGQVRGNTDGDIIRSIVQGGGCGNALSLLLQSSETGVARMGIDFCASLVMPLLEDPRGTATLDEGYNCMSDMSSLGACREAALCMASGPCLPALLGIVNDPDLGGRLRRPIELKKTAIETLASITMAVGEMTKANPHSTEDCIHAILEEGVVAVMLAVLEGSSSQTLSSKETNSSRIRESAGIVISALSMCSADAMVELQSCHAITTMLNAMSDSGSSTLRGDGAPKCLGMLQTAAALLTYAQHDSATPADVVDTLLEAVDAGAISTLSRILFTKIDWESQDKAVGAMKARDAACRMLTAMFGMARADEMAHQRMWDIVDADAHERNPPRNVVTGTLGVLQAAGRVARNSLLGDQRGIHFHAAAMDLVESSLYAVGSMCGSTVVPGLEQSVESIEMMEQCQSDDIFSVRRREACAVACDILTARSRVTQQSILPTMLVGGFGEKTLTASLRLSLAICQNGNLEQHAKLAASGILVPVSDLLKSAMTSGNQFRFSACLALVRFCGPHVGAGTSGGIASVQAAICTATHILAVPTNPSDPIEHVNNTEALKAACIKTLESLSSNASLWSAISKDALPSIVNYLHSASDYGTDKVKTTLCGALRAVARIVGLQSHAISAARAGLAAPLGRLLIRGTERMALNDGDDELPLLALEVLHVLSANKDARNEAGLLESGVIEGVCCALGMSATATPTKPSDGRPDICFWSLEILHYFVEDLGRDLNTVLASPLASAFIEVVAREPRLLKAFCSTLLVKSTMKIPRLGADEDDTMLDVPTLYGPPLILVEEPCAGFKDTHFSAINLFFTIVFLSSALEDSGSDFVWETICWKNNHNADSHKLTATLCAHFLKTLIENKESPFLPLDKRKRGDFDNIARPLVLHSFLVELQKSIGQSMSDIYTISMLVAFEVPRVCLSVWQDPNLTHLAFSLIQLMVDSQEAKLVDNFVESRETLLSLLDILRKSSEIDEGHDIPGVVANILANLSDNGLLAPAVAKFDIRSAAISALAEACLFEESTKGEDDIVATSATLSSRCMHCLVDLLQASSSSGNEMHLTSADADNIASRLGQKICRMVISRFLERAKLSHYEIDEDENLMEAPDVKMLCAIAQHKNSLNIISSLGGISALALVAGEGNLSAVVALKNADSTVLLEANGHEKIMSLLLHGSVSAAIETAALELLADLTMKSPGRIAVVSSDQSSECILYSLRTIGACSDDAAPEELEDENDDEAESTDMEDSADEKLTARKSVHTPEQEVTVIATADSSASVELKCAAISLLSNLVTAETCRNACIKNKDFIPAVSKLIEQTDANLQYHAVRLVAVLAPFATIGGGSVTVDILANCMIDALNNSSNVATKYAAGEGLQTILNFSSPELQVRAMETVLKNFQFNVKQTTIARSARSESDKANMAQLVCTLAGLIVQVSAKDHLRTLLCHNSDLLKSMIYLIEWRYDTTGVIPAEDYSMYWDAATSFSIQHFAFVFCGTLESQGELNMVALTNTILTMARPGKAPRKSCDLKTALERVIAAKRDVTGAVAAQRILAKLADM